MFFNPAQVKLKYFFVCILFFLVVGNTSLARKKEATTEINNTSLFSASQSGTLITAQPSSISAWEGCNVLFSIILSADIDGFQWEVSSDNGTSWSDVLGSEQGLGLDEVTVEMDQYLYRCRVTKDGVEEISSSAVLSVTQAPDVDAGSDRTICGSGVQNYLTVDLSGSTDALMYEWQIENGFGELQNIETLNPVYVVNPKDVGNSVPLTLTVSNPDIGCSLSDEVILTVEALPAFDISTSSDYSFNNYIGRSLHSIVNIAPVRSDPNNPEIEKNNFNGDELLFNEIPGNNLKNRCLLDVSLRDLPVGEELSSAYVYIYTSQAGDFGSIDQNVLELFPISENWNPSAVTWENQPQTTGEGIHPNALSEYERDYINADGDTITYIQKSFRFDLKDIVFEWYTGESLNRGLMLKMSNEAENDVEFVVDSDGSHPGTNGIYWSIGSTPVERVFLCRNEELYVSLHSEEEGLSYSWSGSDVEIGENDEAIIRSHGGSDSSRGYTIRASRENGCSANYYFYTFPSPVVRNIPETALMTGTLVPGVNSSYRVAGSVSNDPGLINWELLDGAGQVFNADRIQSTYRAVEEDFGGTVQLKVTVHADKEEECDCDCNVVTREMDLHVLKPLYPYIGEDFSVCKGTSVTFEQASTGKVPGVSDTELQQQLDAKAQGYVTGFHWEENGQGSFDNPNSLHPTYIPAEDGIENNVVTCRLYVSDGDSFRTDSIFSTIHIFYERTPVITPGIYDAVEVGESVSLSKTLIQNGFRQEWSHDGNGEFTFVEGEVPVYVPSLEDLNNENEQVTFSLTVWSENECEQVTKDIYLSVLPPAEVSAGADQSICAGASIRLQATGGSTYQWSPTTGLDNPDVANPVAQPSVTTTYTVTATNVHNGTEYTASDQVVITVLPLPEADAGEDISLCPGEGVSLSVNEDGATGEDLTYEWFKGDELISSSKTPYVMPEVTQEYKVRVKDQNNCMAEDEVQVIVIQGADVTFDNLSCSGTSATVSVSGYENVSWSPASYFDCATCSSTEILEVDPNVVYSFAGTIFGCPVTKEFKVPLKPSPVITGVTRYEICPGESVAFNLSATGEGNSYSWAPSGSLSSSSVLNPTATPSESTGYQLSVTNSDGCTSTAGVYVEIVEMPELDLSETITLCQGSSADFRISKRSATQIEWRPTRGVSNPGGFFTTLSPETSTSYTITARNGDCETTGNLQVEVIQENDARFNYSFPGMEVHFSAIGEGALYSWSFGDGTTTETDQKYVDHTFSGEGDYRVCLKVTGQCGTHEYCTDVQIKEDNDVGCD